MIRGARKRIFLSSLYIGSSEHELVCWQYCSVKFSNISQINALENSLQLNNEIKVYLQLDYNRSTRPGASSTMNTLLPLLQRFPNRVHVSMFRSPKLKGT